MTSGEQDASLFFWKEAYLDYGQLVTDGFYHVRKSFPQLPTLAEFRADPRLAGGQVIMLIDRDLDTPLVTLEALVREQLPRLRTEADRAALLANLICEAFGNCMGAVTEDSNEPPLLQLQKAFGNGPIPVGELVAAGLGGARSRAITFKAIADGLPPQYRLRTRLVRAPYPSVLAHELQLHAWNDVVTDGREYVVDLMDDAGALYEKASMEAAQYESLGRADDALLVKMLDAGLVKLKAGNHLECRAGDIIRDEVVGKGTSAEVYKLILSSGQTLAIKRMTEPENPQRRSSRSLFRDEVEVLSTMHHPNIISLYGATETADELFIMMEYAAGGSLWDLLSKPQDLPFARRMEVALDAARGLQYLHTCNPQILHCDVKGNNVLIGADGVAKLADFGLSVIMANQSASIKATENGTSHPHTERWAAPEVLEGLQVDEKADVYSFAMLLFEIFSKAAPWHHVFPQQIRELVLSQKRPAVPADAKFGIGGIITSCWAHKSTKRPFMVDVVNELLNAAFNYLWDVNGHGSLTEGDAKLLVQCLAPSKETNKRVAQRQDFSARCISSLAGPDGDIDAKLALLDAGAIPALLALLENGNDKCREAAAEALGALGDYATKDPAARELLKISVMPVLLQLLHTTNHDGTRVSVLAAVKTLTWPPANSDFRSMFVASGGISALVQALQDGSSRAKASAVELLLGFAMDGHDNQEWIGAAPGAIAALVDLLRSSNVEAVNTAGQVLIILVDIPHCRADAAAAGAVAAVAVLLKPASEDEVAATEEVAAILLSKLVLEPDTHAAISKAGAIPTLVKQVAAARDGGRERMLAAVLRTLGACAEDNSANASRVIAARGVMPSFQLLNSRLSTIRREAAFTVACLFQSGASKADAEELINVEGRLMHYLVDGITEGRERDQAYAAILLARLLTHAANATTMARELLANGAAVTSMLGMLTSWEEPVRLSAVRALAKVCWQGIDPAAEGLAEEDASNSRSSGSTVAGAPPRDLVNSFRSRGVQGSIAIGNLAELLESEDELTRFTTAKVLIALWFAGPWFREEFMRHAEHGVALALAETLQMGSGGLGREDVLELCLAVLHVKTKRAALEAVPLCPEWATFFWTPPGTVAGGSGQNVPARIKSNGYQ